MTSLPGRLGTLTANDVMTKSLICVSESDNIDAALATLKSHHITGAPVVDADNKLVGILSLSDLVQTDGSAGDSGVSHTPLAHGNAGATWDLFEIAQPLDEQAGQELVRDRMSSTVTSVTQYAPLVEVARVMCDGHWHRVPVVDAAGKLHGIISTMDVLAAMVHAADEVS